MRMQRTWRDGIGSRGLALLLALIWCCAVDAQTYAAKPVRIVVPFAAGGPADIYARAIGQKLQDAFGQAFVIDDRPGAGAVIGTESAAKSPADGYTLLMMSNTHTVNESLLKTKPYDLLRDFTPVAAVNYSDLVMVVHPSVQAVTLKEFIDLAKAKPGALNYASSGPGTPYHMAGELFKSMAGIDVVHVPYKGSAGARTDVMGGQVQMMFDAVTTMAPLVRSGKLRALATTGLARSSVLLEVPTMAEAGVPMYEATIWLGIMAPAGTPKAIVDKLNMEINKVLANADVKDAWAKQGATTMNMSREQFGKYLRADIEKWGRIVKSATISVD